MNYDELRSALDFGESCRKITEAYCVLRGLPIDRKFSDEALAEPMAEIVVALAQVKAESAVK